ncbi:universal stress protein [Dissulfurispira thermophila]|uniref:Universal stress protein n=2 Tax=root TaxID=1 RepID=A0A7G1H4E0_9BACT|nr:universal stress protein [Dissulfurispira thermophila]BCB96993.1 universal stress protein [Dissulfurispira thermophila]
MTINKILAAIDLGPDTEKILAYAEWLYKVVISVTGDTQIFYGIDKDKKGDAQIEMLYVIDYAVTPPAYLTPYIEKEKRLDEGELKKWADKLNNMGIKIRHTIAVGRLIDAFNTIIKEIRADILVLGYRSHVIRPSSSERIIKSLNIPMLVIRGKKSEGAYIGGISIKRILCAVDFSEPSKKALEFARSLSEETSSELVVTHIISSLKIEKGFKKWKDLTEKDKSNYSSGLIENAEEQMCSLLKVCNKTEGIVKIGIPHETINNLATQTDADIIVIGARGLSYTKGLLLGSVSESVIKSSPCPVIIVR